MGWDGAGRGRVGCSVVGCDMMGWDGAGRGAG